MRGKVPLAVGKVVNIGEILWYQNQMKLFNIIFENLETWTSYRMFYFHWYLNETCTAGSHCRRNVMWWVDCKGWFSSLKPPGCPGIWAKPDSSCGEWWLRTHVSCMNCKTVLRSVHTECLRYRHRNIDRRHLQSFWWAEWIAHQLLQRPWRNCSVWLDVKQGELFDVTER